MSRDTLSRREALTFGVAAMTSFAVPASAASPDAVLALARKVDELEAQWLRPCDRLEEVCCLLPGEAFATRPPTETLPKHLRFLWIHVPGLDRQDILDFNAHTEWLVDRHRPLSADEAAEHREELAPDHAAELDAELARRRAEGAERLRWWDDFVAWQNQIKRDAGHDAAATAEQAAFQQWHEAHIALMQVRAASVAGVLVKLRQYGRGSDEADEIALKTCIADLAALAGGGRT